MKILRLNLQAFGHFTDKSIDLSGKAGLNIIFGPNEAGKSTAMRALDAFFFGFGLRSEDAFVHEYKDLAVGAVLGTGSGRVLELTRYKRNKNDLVDRDGQALEPGFMSRLMSGLTREMYTSMFSMDHFSIRQGAREILKGGGHLGETLFAAASGFTSLRQAMDDLGTKADALFRPRATSRPIWQCALEISRLNRQLRELSVRPEQWRHLKSDLEKIQKEKNDLDLRIRNLESSLHAYQRFYRALPHISAYHELNARLEELKTIPDLSPDFSGNRVRVLTTMNRLSHELEQLTRVETDVSAQLKKIKVCEQTLNYAHELERLFHQSPLIAQARDNILSLEQEIKTLEALILEKSALLPGKNLPQNLEELHPGPARIKKIETLAGQLVQVNSRLAQNAGDMKDLEHELQITRAGIREMPPVPDCRALDMLSRDMSLAPELLKQEAGSRLKIRKLQVEIEKEISSLGLWQGDLAELAGMALPLRETMDRFEQDISRARQEMETCKNNLAQSSRLLDSKKSELSRLDPDESIPDPRDLAAARNLRDEGWSLVKGTWLESSPDKDRTAAFLRRTDSSHLAPAFEKSQIMADREADRLLDNADQVAARSGLTREIMELEEKNKHLESALEAGTKSLELLTGQWEDQWSGLNITPLSPKEMGAWMLRVAEIKRLGQELDHEFLELDSTSGKMNQLCRTAVKILAREGFTLPEKPDLSALSSLVEEARRRSMELMQNSKNLERDLSRIRLSLDRLAARKQGLEGELSEIKEKWRASLTSAFLDPGREPGDILEEIRIRQEIYSSSKELEKLTLRKKAMDKKCRVFSSQAARLVKNMGYPETAEGRPEDIVGRLHVRLKNEQKKAGERSDLLARLEETRTRIGQISSELDVLQGEMSIICREGGTDDPHRLPEIEEKSALKKELRTRLENTLEHLRELASGKDPVEFAAEVQDFDSDELKGLISGLEKEKQELEPRLEQVRRQVLEAELRLRDMDGTSRVPQVEQKIQEQRALLENHVQQYVRCRLAYSILAAEIERYRTASQGPVLRSAGDIFREITLGSFTAVIADYDEKGEPVIRAVKKSGDRLGVDQLSDGSRDQLFLALRLGGIHSYLQSSPAFPLLLDDILVHFDDERSQKTLSVLAGISRETQVVFFTHHRHLVNLAKGIPEKNMVRVHEL